MNSETLRDTLFVAHLSLLRGWRRALDNPRRLVLRAGFFVLLFLYIVLGEPRQYPSQVEPAQLRETIRGLVAGLWLASAGAAVLNTPTDASSVQGSPLLLRSAGLRPTLWGTMLGQYARRVVLFGVFVVVTALAVLWGVDSPTRNPFVLLALLVFFLTAELTGMAVRLGAAATGFRPGRTGRVVLGGIGVVALSLAVGAFETTVALLSHLPIAVFGDAFLFGVPELTANTVLLGGATVGGVVAALVLAVTVEQLARRTWFTGGQRERVDTERTRVDDLLGRLGFDGPTRAVAWRLWLQSRRQPLVMGLLSVPALLTGLALVDPEGTDLPLFPLLVGLYTVWMATVVVGLNPLSSEDGTLPHLLSASGTEIVRGYALTTVFVGVPVIVVSVLLAGLLVGPVWLTGPALLLSAVVMSGVVPAAIALGVVLPRVGALQFAVDGPIAPGKFAIGAFSLLLGLLAAPAVIGLTVAGTVSPVVVFAGIGVTIIAALLVGTVSLRVAARQLDRLTLG